ncbi:nucleotidyl transferase AbiEii/AbiGii toxin family protein [Teredinibacter turnerae]|uniref:nucleotidyl transferase AbiEii/AbiGii toxin family protein n=1 Tax=Teredinibacter turnerae TaxID=2426 RepID=UPI000374A389|nr:nucleotidyl transferase AbiEii/AbiGii toxin family protein [Teredinibacter turnerae]
MSKTKKNIAASVRQRLLNKAKAEKRPFNELLQYYAMERFLYRLSLSAHAERFILKGALMLRVWQAPEARPTMDIDMLGKTDNSTEAISEQVKDILATEVANDGMVFDADSLSTETIKEDADYHGVRVRLKATLENAHITLQLDIGFGDALVPEATLAEFPILLDLPAPKILCYSRESAIAEKFEAMVKLGELNSRMKDFYDIWLLACQFDFQGATLGDAIKQTFDTRGTEFPSELPINYEFIEQKQKQWQAFHKRLNTTNLPEEFNDVCAVLTEFLVVFLPSSTIPKHNWRAGGPWAAVQRAK